MMIPQNKKNSCSDDCSDMGSSDKLSLVQTYLKALFKNSENIQEVVDAV